MNWKIKMLDIGRPGSIVEENGAVVCSFNPTRWNKSRVEAMEVAYLLSSAPELYQALRRLLGIVRDGNVDSLAAAFDQADDALERCEYDPN